MACKSERLASRVTRLSFGGIGVELLCTNDPDERTPIAGSGPAPTGDLYGYHSREYLLVKPLPEGSQILCLARGQYQRFNGPHSEHKCRVPRKVRGVKLYEPLKITGQVGYIAGRREKGAFIVNDAISGKKVAEVTPRKLLRVAHPSQGWMITQQSVLGQSRKERGGSSPVETGGFPRHRKHGYIK